MINLFILKDITKYVIDCFIYNNDLTKVYFIELNPFEDFVDTFSFDYDVINNTKTLLITL